MESLIRLPEVMRRTGLGRTSVYHLMSKGEFPRSLSLSPRMCSWVASEIDQWIRERIASCRAAETAEAAR
jgi:prophage regulatory protein